MNFIRKEVVSGNSISKINDYTFRLGEKGVYKIDFKVVTAEPIKLVFVLNGTELDYTLTESDFENSQINGSFLIETDNENSDLYLKNISDKIEKNILAVSTNNCLPALINITIIQIS